MAQPPVNPGVMTPDEKAALGARLGLDTPPAVTSGSGTVSGDLSSVNVAEMQAEMADAYREDAAYQREVHDVILASPAGSTATEGYHLDEQSEALREDERPLPVGPVPDRPPQQRA